MLSSVIWSSRSDVPWCTTQKPGLKIIRYSNSPIHDFDIQNSGAIWFIRRMWEFTRWGYTVSTSGEVSFAPLFLMLTSDVVRCVFGEGCSLYTVIKKIINYDQRECTCCIESPAPHLSSIPTIHFVRNLCNCLSTESERLLIDEHRSVDRGALKAGSFTHPPPPPAMGVEKRLTDLNGGTDVRHGNS